MRAPLVCLLFAASPAVSAPADLATLGKADQVRKLTAAIDRLVADGWAAHGVHPAPEAGDAEFLRRVHLDLVGRIPRVAEVRTFLADPDPDKRAKLVEKLMEHPGYAQHLAAAARADWIPQSLTDFRSIIQGNQFEDWLRRQYAANTPADQIARTVLTASVFTGRVGRAAFIRNRGDNPDLNALSGFYQANDAKPENLAATVSRVFLGVKLECAQCHNHPFAAYTKDQFWEFAAFFGEFTPLPPTGPSFVGPQLPQADANQLTIPNTTRTVTARYFDGSTPDWSRTRTPRQELADWLTGPKNPYFARNLANRTWAHFFGIGIVNPIDEPGEANPPSHPELLNALAAGLVESGFDMRVLIRAITASRAYNLSSQQTDPSQADIRRFARMSVRGLTAHQIYDSFLAATGLKDARQPNQQFFRPNDTSGRTLFRNLFGDVVPKPTDAQTSILQALMMMNGVAVADQTSVDKSEVLAAIADAPFLDTKAKVETLFLAALSRFPRPEETEKYASYVDRGGPTGDKNKAIGDVFWVLLNSGEFLFNH